jgi:branched-chain amino acid transport system substrate-binding protein
MTVTRRAVIKAVGVTAFTAAAGGGRTSAQSDKTIVFGGSVPMSGKDSETGLNVLQGYRIAVKFINEKLGGATIAGERYKLDLRIFDDASDPQRASTLIQRQLDGGTDFFLGSFSSAIVLPTAAITERARKPMVQAGGGSDQIFTRHFRYVFGMYPRASRQLVSLVEMLKTTGGEVKTCSIVTTNDPFSKAQADGTVVALEAAGIQLLDILRLPATATDVSGIVNDLRSRTPDALICTTHQQNSALIVQQLISTGTSVKLLFLALGPENAQFRENLGKYADGITTIQYWLPSYKFTDPFFGTTQAYYAYYSENAERRESYQTVAASVCITSFVKAMQDAKTLEPERVRDTLATLDYESVYGPVKFTPDGDGDPVLMGAAIGQLQKGGVEIVYPGKVATAKLIFPMQSWANR